MHRYSHHGQPIMDTNHQHHLIQHLPVPIIPPPLVLRHTRVNIIITISLNTPSLINIIAHPRYKVIATCLVHPYHHHQQPLSMRPQQRRWPRRQKRTNTHALMPHLTHVLLPSPLLVMRLVMARSIPVKRVSTVRFATRLLRGRII